MLEILRFHDNHILINKEEIAPKLDTARKDPTGSWNLGARDFYLNGRSIGKEHYPTLVVQEGGYDTRRIGINASSFFTGLWEGSFLS